MRAAVVSVMALRAASGDVTPSVWGRSRSVIGRWLVYVFKTWRYSGWTEVLTSTSVRFVISAAMWAASPVALAPSYIDALATSIPVSSQIMVWYS